MIKYKLQPIRYGEKRRPSKTVPNQAMSIKTIMERFTRGIPVDAVQREKVFVDQDEYDLEKLANASFDEKARMAVHLKNQNDSLMASLEAQKAQAQRAEQGAARQKETRTGIAPDDDEGGGQEDGERVTQRPRPTNKPGRNQT